MIHLKNVILPSQLEVNKYVLDVQVPVTPKPYWKIIDR